MVARIGSARCALQIDVGFGDAVTPEPQTVAYRHCEHPLALTKQFSEDAAKLRQWQAFLNKNNGAKTGPHQDRRAA